MSRQLSLALMEHWANCLEVLSSNGYRPASIRSYDQVLREFFSWVNDQADLQELSDLTTQALQNYVIYLSLRGHRRSRKGSQKKLLSASTKQGHINGLTHLFRHLTKRGLLLTDPTHELERPRAKKSLPRTILSVKEMLRVLARINGIDPVSLRNRAALELLYSTAIRRSEMERLTLSSLRLEERILIIDGKGGKERLVPIGKEALRYLSDYLRHGRPKLPSEGSKALFLSITGGAMSPRSILRILKIEAKAARIKKRVDLHSIRHTCATHMLANGADIRYIQELLGHASLKTTQMYTRVEISDLKKMLDKCHPREQF